MADGIKYDGSTKKLSVTSNANETLVVTGSNVGIGTASPAVKLDINGEAKILNILSR